MELRGVAVRYGRRRPLVLGQVSLTLPAGSLVEVTGRNGAGKSSLLRVLAGVLRPTMGVVLSRPAVVGWAPEHLPTAQPFTAGAYLLAQARVRGLDARAAAQAVARQARRLNLEPLLETRLPELSLGSAQKIGLAQALLVRPGLLVLDEPWSSLDAHARTAVPALVRDVLQDGGRVVVTDHQGQAAALSPDRRWHVADGTVVDHPGQVDDRVAVEVEVPAVDAPALLEELRRRGLSPRLR
jgi:ABC-2 type transport system ATP-binding protein